MNGYAAFPIQGFGAEGFLLGASFQTNGSSDPASTTFRAPPGFVFTVAYSATGIYTVTLASNLKLAAQALMVAAWPQYATLATDWFECGVVGETTLNASARQFVIQAHRNGTANAPANTAGNRINFALYTRNSTGA